MKHFTSDHEVWRYIIYDTLKSDNPVYLMSVFFSLYYDSECAFSSNLVRKSIHRKQQILRIRVTYRSSARNCKYEVKFASLRLF